MSFAWAQAQAQVTLHFEHRNPSVVSDTLKLSLMMENSVDVRGLELNILPFGSDISYLNMALTPRSNMFSLIDTLYSNGQLRMIMTSLAGLDILTGTGEIAHLNFLINNSNQTCTPLQFGFVMASGPGTTTFNVDAIDFCADLTNISSPKFTLDTFQLSCFPNPFNNTLNISWMPSTHATSIAIFNIRGEGVLSLPALSMKQNSYRWETQNMPSGIYMVQITNSIKSQYQRVLLLQ